MFLQPLDLTTALRPSLLPDETLLFVQDTIGLYQGKYKIPNLQDGHAYLTSHRVCYVDNKEPRKNSVAFELKNVDRYEYYAGFLKSSAKVTVYPKAPKRTTFYSRQQGIQNLQSSAYPNSRSSTVSPIHRQASTYTAGTPSSSAATWVCTICSFSNPVSSNFDPATANANTPIPPCLACGIRPTFPQVLKAAIASAAGRQASPAPVSSQPLTEAYSQTQNGYLDDHSDPESNGLMPPLASRFQCPRCTFLNHPSLLACELCGAPLLSSESKAHQILGHDVSRPESPGPMLNSEGTDPDTNELICIKISFRAGGEKIFHERLKNAMVQRKWLLQNAPPIPDPLQSLRPNGTPEPQSSFTSPPTPTKSAGIAGLEARGLQVRQKNEAVIGSAFEDLDALMASAKEIVALAESFANKSSSSNTDGGTTTDSASLLLAAESAKALNMVTTKDMLSSSTNNDSLYLSEMSRNLAEYLTDDAKGVLRKEGGIMSLVDLWAVFNRARGGVELISPAEFEKAALLWERLRLPVRLRRFRNGLLVVQQADRTDEKTVRELVAWLREVRGGAGLVSERLEGGEGEEVEEEERDEEFLGGGDDVSFFGRGVTAQEAAQRFGWSVGVAVEELEMAEERGVLCREVGVEGCRFWENWFGVLEGERGDEWGLLGGVGGGSSRRRGKEDEVEDVVRNLRATGLLL